MPRYFFHTEDGAPQRDDDGVELPGLADARREAARALGEMLMDQPDAFWADGGLKLTVTDGRGLILFVLEASPTVAPAGAAPRKARPKEAGSDGAGPD